MTARGLTREELAELEGAPRRERLLALWDALGWTDNGQARAWALLSDERRCDFVAVVFDAVQIP